ncbi:MAG: hypothetical protein MUF27_12305, partial [Acidobacteria bacterium]|nr:hypothetical protein [Acidobacteriota bacterium]
RQALLEGPVQDVGFVVIAFLLQLEEVERGPFLEQLLGRGDLAARERRYYEELRRALERG